MQLLFAYNDWANKRALRGAATLTADQFSKPLGNSFSSVRDTLVHMYGAENVWLQRFRGGSPSPFPHGSKSTDTPSLKSKWPPAAADLLDYVNGLTQEDIDRVVEYKT